MKYRKKPVVIDAEWTTGSGWHGEEDRIPAFFRSFGFTRWSFADDGGFDIETLEGTMHANPGDWILRGVQGEFYPCKPDIFAATYEAVEEIDR